MLQRMISGHDNQHNEILGDEELVTYDFSGRDVANLERRRSMGREGEWMWKKWRDGGPEQWLMCQEKNSKSNH